MLSARQKLSATWAKSRQTPARASYTSAAVVSAVLLPWVNVRWSLTWSQMAATRR